ncbi:hypothetical protein [Sanguibacter sp. Z1732]|uniref:hypothetical protein n=1 Tax=Sanguibacter sp. Z1732 TaxID=3435412 RepID=UPI003D9C9490
MLVQVSDDHLKRHGYEAHAEALARSKSLAPYRIRFFIAGTAPGHDSAASYERLIAHMRKIAPEREIDISTARRPLDLVDEIASARLWIGLSLHGRIVSSAYDVPRISLTKRKLNSYSATWDPHMPYDVTPDRLDDAVAQALDPVTMKESAGIGLDLAHRAKHNIESAVSEMLGSDPDERTRRRFAQVERRRQHLAHDLASRDTEIAVLRRELETTNAHLADLRKAPGALGRATYRGLNAVKNRLKKSD